MGKLLHAYPAALKANPSQFHRMRLGLFSNPDDHE
jgi:hypothetical protein